MGNETAFRSKAGDEVVDATLKLVPGAEHPVVGTHPVTGRKYLYVNSEFTSHIVQMSKSKNRAILDLLVAHCANPNFTMR